MLSVAFEGHDNLQILIVSTGVDMDTHLHVLIILFRVQM